MRPPFPSANKSGLNCQGWGRTGWTGGWLVALLWLAGCATESHQPGLAHPDRPPQNVFSQSPVLPASLRRVAILPLACEASATELSESCAVLGPGLLEELIRTQKFEVVSVSPESLRRHTGRADWTGGETLPVDFFGVLRREYGCDAVMFCELTTFHAYSPLIIGWRFKLVNLQTRQIIWAADEVFDTKPPATGVGGWLVEQGRQLVTPDVSDEWVVLNSPTRFGRYSAAQLLTTLPER